MHVYFIHGMFMHAYVYIWKVPRRELSVICDNLGYYLIIVYLLFQVFCLLRES